MQAVVLTDEAEIVLKERPEPVAQAGEALIRVAAAGICGTDLHAPLMPGMFADNVVLGHEFAGTIMDVGADVGDLVAGQYVVVNPIAMSCGACEACKRGLTNQCMAALTQVTGVARNGGMAEFVTADQRSIHVVPEGLSIHDAAWTEPLAVALRAMGHGPVRAGTTVAVLGAGAIGQLITQLAVIAGAAEVLVVETSPLRRRVAGECGASLVISPDQLSEVDRLYDVVFDCTGATQAFPSSLALVGHGGRVVVLGTYPTPLSLQGVGREASIVFSSVYRDDREFAAALRLLARGVMNIRPLTTSVLPIDRYDEAFASLRDPERAVKIFLDPSL